MKERPILFSATMVRALLAGSKTQTRRLVKPQPTHFLGGPGTTDDQGRQTESTPMRDGNGMSIEIRCPYGAPGDRLWVRESWSYFEREPKPGDTIYYRADGECLALQPWSPSIHMPRWASRITLDVVGVRVERLQDISEADAQAEGVAPTPWPSDPSRVIDWPLGPLRNSYYLLWEQINGAGSWDSNPWVWVVEFKRVTP